MSYYNGLGKTPCKYFQRGQCKFGNRCKFSHVYTNSDTNSNSNNDITTENDSGLNNFSNFIDPRNLDLIKRDLTSDMNSAFSIQFTPLSSSYSLGFPCTLNLISGRDYSPEEARHQYYEAQRTGTLPQYEQEMRSRALDMQKCIDHVKKHADWGARYLQKNSDSMTRSAQHQRAITQDFINFPLDLNASNNPAVMSSFGNPFTSGVKPNLSNTNGMNPFTANVTNNNAMGASAFGQPSFGGANATAGGTTASAFGAPQFGANTSNTANTTMSAFGSTTSTAKPSAFGAPAFGSAAPANANAPPTTSAFGAPSFGSSGFGSGAATANPFSKAPSSMGSAFGQAGFGLNGAAATTPSVTNNNMGSAFGALQNKTVTSSSPFGSMQQNTLPNSSSASSAFGKPAFGAASNTQSAFGTNQNKTTSAGAGAAPFGSFGVSSNNKSPFGNLQNGAPPVSSPFGFTNSEANSNGNNSPFVATNNQAVSNKSPFGMAATGTFGSVSNPSAMNTNTNASVQSPFGNKGFSFGIASQTDANKASQTTSPFGQAVSNTNTNFQNNSTTSFGQQPASTGANNTNAGARNTRFLQGVPSEKDCIIELSDLAEETIKIFKANKFELGLVPDIPPPSALVA
ncbi:hypothetical protein N7582_000392 [Saccharomyces uvarum]|nr:hypothetical protein N7582_000392 [Saccharomyces uvarum]